MNRKQFATGAGIIVDVCRKHGTFFDVGELPAIIDYVMKGGLEKAAKKDLEAERQRIERERKRMEASAGSSLRIEIERDVRRGTAMIDLLAALIS